MAEPHAADSSGEAAELSASAKENLEVLERFVDREEAKVTGLRLQIERISGFFGSPRYLIFTVLFMAGWIGANLWGAHAGWRHVDVPPFPWLQGMVTCNGLLLTVAVLIRQSRQAQLAEHRSHLDLQINLLTEQKVTKILQIVDELHADLRMLRGKPKSTAEPIDELTKPADAHAILNALSASTALKSSKS